MGSFKDKIKKGKRAAARISILSLAKLVEILPFPLIEGFLKSALSVGFCFLFHHRRVARESLRIAFGQEKTAEQIEEIVRQCFVTIRNSAVDLLYYARFPETVTQKCDLEGLEHLDAALRRGKGVLMVTAHFGNFPVMMLALAKRGYKTNVIMRRARDEKIADRVLTMMDKVGVRTIYAHPRRECVTESIRALRNNELLFVLLDQHFGSDGGVVVDFFGQPAATAPGPIIMVTRTQSSILPIFNVRQKDGRLRIFIEPEVQLEKNDDSELMIKANVAKITQIIEARIRKYPHEWGWMHRRWKNLERKSGAQNK